MQLPIKDPRVYTSDYPASNILINQAIAVLHGQLLVSQLQESLVNSLVKENDALINVALNLAPSLEVARLIWDNVDYVINHVNHAAVDYLPKETCSIFAIPVVLVVGSSKRCSLPANIDVTRLNHLFSLHNIFSHSANTFISGKLLSPDILGQIKLSQQYYWRRTLMDANLWLPLAVEGSGIVVENEGVFLRFLVGLGEINEENFRRHSIELMHFINGELKTSAVALFSLPFAPVSLANAFVVGNNWRKEIAIQVALSNIVRKIREQNLTPLVTVTGGADCISVITTTKEPSCLSETSLWHLTKIDDIAAILAKLTSLFVDLHLEWSYGG